MQAAYRKEMYQEAKKELTTFHQELQQQNMRAANSLAEAMKETLTLHRLGGVKELGRSLLTTNIIENLKSRLGARLRKVKRWVNSSQRQRWVAMAILNIESRLRTLPSAEHLAKLQKALLDSVPQDSIEPSPNR